MRSKKVWMAVAAVAVCIGFVCVGAGLAMGGSLYDIRIALGFEDGRPHLGLCCRWGKYMWQRRIRMISVF